MARDRADRIYLEDGFSLRKTWNGKYPGNIEQIEKLPTYTICFYSSYRGILYKFSPLCVVLSAKQDISSFSQCEFVGSFYSKKAVLNTLKRTS